MDFSVDFNYKSYGSTAAMGINPANISMRAMFTTGDEIFFTSLQDNSKAFKFDLNPSALSPIALNYLEI